MIEMERYSSSVLRIWRMTPWIRNPLLRPSDRLEGVVRIVAVVVVLVAIPMCGAIGTARYGSAVVEARAENAAKVEVAATLLDDPVLVASSTTTGVYDDRNHAAVQWNRDGQIGAATIEVARTAKAGERVALWLGPDGRPADPPSTTSASAAWRAVGLGLGILAEIWLGTAAVVWLTAWVFGRRRQERWTREWRQISRPIGQDQ
ncbi:hypothetical protein [Nocardia sp. BMG51109]|uniref:Rv1733c family protein n=1 Tax=Nocardia sp. BMG51109 TaxID=1056816 RepID=UPI000464A027|nr:hypothetical protein [Nocardia sp. BMG51109]